MLSRDHNILWLPESNGYPTEDKWDRAAEYYDKLAEVTSSPESLFRLGVSLHKNGQWEQAAMVYEKCVRHKEDWPEAWLNRGVAHLKLEDYEKAQQAFSKALEYKDDDPEALLGLASVFAKQGKLR